jgi:hypothetical protein
MGCTHWPKWGSCRSAAGREIRYGTLNVPDGQAGESGNITEHDKDMTLLLPLGTQIDWETITFLPIEHSPSRILSPLKSLLGRRFFYFICFFFIFLVYLSSPADTFM